MTTLPDEPGSIDDRPGAVTDQATWEVIHSKFAESALAHATQVRMQTSDGLFRITATRVDDRLGVTIERFVPEPLDADAGLAGDVREPEPARVPGLALAPAPGLALAPSLAPTSALDPAPDPTPVPAPAPLALVHDSGSEAA